MAHWRVPVACNTVTMNGCRSCVTASLTQIKNLLNDQWPEFHQGCTGWPGGRTSGPTSRNLIPVTGRIIIKEDHALRHLSMKRRHESHWLPHTPGQMFDLAADIERYPEFLPFWTHARIVRRTEGILTVQQELDLGIQRLRFQSRAELDRPGHLHISSDAALFRRMEIDWRFTPGERDGCIAALTVELEMRSLLMDTLADRLVQLLTRDIFRRFIDRAAALYPG
jgi:coenzyme Q-binding protein COQ10